MPYAIVRPRVRSAAHSAQQENCVDWHGVVPGTCLFSASKREKLNYPKLLVEIFYYLCIKVQFKVCMACIIPLHSAA